MGGLPSLLTAVLLRAAPSCTPAEARPERLPPNFVEVAACVMRVLNNVARWVPVTSQLHGKWQLTTETACGELCAVEIGASLPVPDINFVSTDLRLLM